MGLFGTGIHLSADVTGGGGTAELMKSAATIPLKPLLLRRRPGHERCCRLGEPSRCKVGATGVIGALSSLMWHRRGPGATGPAGGHRQRHPGRAPIHCLSLAGDRLVELGERRRLNIQLAQETPPAVSRRVCGGRRLGRIQKRGRLISHRLLRNTLGPIPLRSAPPDGV